MNKTPFPLTYVCRYCGTTCGTFPGVRSASPTTLSVCDKADCRRQASRDWKLAV